MTRNNDWRNDMVNKHIGSRFDDFLEEEGILAEVESVAIKRVVAWQLRNYMAEENISKTAFAATLKTSRSALDRLLDPDNVSVNLNTLVNAVAATGKRIEFSIS